MRSSIKTLKRAVASFHRESSMKFVKEINEINTINFHSLLEEKKAFLRSSDGITLLIRFAFDLINAYK
jgi:hypothetical protein